MKNNQNKQSMRGGKRAGAGRPQGSANRVTQSLREMLYNFTAQALGELPALYAGLESDRERLELIIRLLPYVAPRLQAIAMHEAPVKESTGLDGLTFEELYRLKYGKSPANEDGKDGKPFEVRVILPGEEAPPLLTSEQIDTLIDKL